MPALKLTGKPAGKSPARKSKPAAKQAPTRKPAASKAPARKPAAKQAAQPAPESNGNGNGRSPRLPEGMTKREFERIVKDMRKARKAREDAEARVKEARDTANQMALDLIGAGVQMSVVSSELDLSRQWLYKIMEDNGVKTARQAQASKPRGRSAASSRTSKPAAKKRPAAKQAATRKPPAAKKAPARKAPPARKPAASGRGRVRISGK